MKYLTATMFAVVLATAAACSDRAVNGPTSPSAAVATALSHENGGARPIVIITDAGLQPRQLEVSNNSPVTFINRSSVSRWIRSDDHEPGGHLECPEFEAIGILAPGQSGSTGMLAHERCDYHDHLMGANLTSNFEGRVRIRN